MNLWFECPVRVKDFKLLSVAYHKAVKQTAGMNTWDNNHGACSQVGVNTMRHLFSKRLLKSFMKLVNTHNSLVSKLRYFLMLRSSFYRFISRMCTDLYGIDLIHRNDLAALLARIDFVEKNEPRSCYVPEPP